MNKEVDLKMRWCEDKDQLKGWVILHSEVTGKLKLRHLDHIKLKCINTDKAIHCRVFGPGHNGYHGLNNYEIENTIFMDSHYQQLLGIDYKKLDGREKYKFEISKSSNYFYYYCAAKYHPDDGVRIGAYLGKISLFLGIVSLIISFISLVISIVPKS